ncbi:MAG: sulfate adenylyltransferase subunit CysN [Rubrivivax sp.]|nr:sulfate adenylyltransferase subunit CysN [Rubrivivax sp.]
MSHRSELIASDIDAFLAQHQHKSLLRFITCGSVDDGKSTLIGRLLYDSQLLFDDQLAAVQKDSQRWGTQGAAPDLALLVDGLAAEREQGITIDVAYRYFSTERRKFIVADTPGHEQYTRNMVTGASTADLAVILIDARKGVLTQTRRHSFLVHLLGVTQVVLAVNKMDLVGWDDAVFHRIDADFRAYAAQLGLADIVSIPLSALDGDNVISRSPRMPWYSGPTLLEQLETCPLDETRLQAGPLRLPVQWVNRPGPDFRAYCGLIASGSVRPGELLRAQPSGRQARVARIVTTDGDLPLAVAGQSVALTLDAEIDISRGDMLSAATAPAEVADQFECTLVWMGDDPMLPGRPYRLKIGARTVGASFTAIKHEINVNTLEHLAAPKLALNGIAVCNLALDAAVPFDAYRELRETGGFIVIDRITLNTVGAGMLHFALRRAHNIALQPLDVGRADRAALMRQTPRCVWLTGLSGAGKSTLANLLQSTLHAQGRHVYVLDGDNLRHGLNRDLGFTAADRVENVRRTAEVARLMVDAGLIVIVSLISPYRAERRLARELFAPGDFVEVFVDAPLQECERRDTKGLYAKARRGELKNFTGIDSPYEPPEAPELHLDTTAWPPADGVARIVELLG